MKGVFVHRPDSVYDDLPEVRYQFPSRYRDIARSIEGDWIVYYEPRRSGGRMGYNGVARIERIIEDPTIEKMYIAIIEPGSFVPFEVFVPFRTETGFLESRLVTPSGNPSGIRQSSVRTMSDRDFFRILARGFSTEDGILPRVDAPSDDRTMRGVREDVEPFESEFARERVEQTLNRSVRDRAFRKCVVEAYEHTCPVTSLKLINGGGRAEVVAAHIRPVASNGSDSPRNGIALSGTVHWMFDRGLISLSNELEVLVSRQVNNPDQIWEIVNRSRKANAPANASLRPHPMFLEWHRENVFKN